MDTRSSYQANLYLADGQGHPYQPRPLRKETTPAPLRWLHFFFTVHVF